MFDDTRWTRSLASEEVGGYAVGASGGAVALAPVPGGWGPRLRSLTGAVDAVVDVPVDELSEAAVSEALGVLETQVRRLRAAQGRLAGALADRQARRAIEARPGDARAGERARRQVAQDLASQLGWTAGKAKRTLETQRQLAGLPEAAAAVRAGALTAEHARVLVDTLRHLVGVERTALEAELVAAAQGLDAVAFGRVCRRRLAEVSPEDALADLDRLHARRAARLVHHADGTTTLWARLSGVGAETVHTGIDAFRTPDAPGEPPRTPEQRTADGLVAMAQAALDHGVDTTEHGSRPHIQVRIDWADLVASTGTGEATWTGPIPTGEVRRLLDDSTISRLVTGPDSLPLDVGRASRSVPAGVWRALVDRDGSCTYRGCDAPPGWCDAAHLDRRWVDGAGVSVGELALACRPHHRHIDRRGLIGRVENGRVTWHPPD